MLFKEWNAKRLDRIYDALRVARVHVEQTYGTPKDHRNKRKQADEKVTESYAAFEKWWNVPAAGTRENTMEIWCSRRSALTRAYSNRRAVQKQLQKWIGVKSAFERMERELKLVLGYMQSRKRVKRTA